MIYVALVVFGLVFGSFVNALVWRLHEQEELREQLEELKGGKAAQTKREKLKQQLRERSMLHGRSMCSYCHHELAAKDLIPLVSWLWLRGKCRYCGVKIQDSPWAEITLAGLFALSYLWWPTTFHGVGLFEFVLWLIFLIAFVALADYDLRWFILPNKIVFPLIVLAVFQVATVAIVRHDIWVVLDGFFGVLALSGTFWVLFQLSGGAWIGGGDVKLAIVLGLLAGSAIQSLLVLFFASVIGTAFSIPLLLRGRKGLKMHVPFGPYLLAATFVVVLFGQNIIDWYTGLIPH